MNEINFCTPDENTPKLKGLLREFKPHKKAIYSLAITPDRKYAVTGSLDTTIKVWELESGNSIHVLEGHEDEVRSVSVSSDGGRVVSGSEDQTVKLWKLETGNLMRNFTDHEGAILDVVITPNDKYIISISEDKTAKIWNWSTKKIIRVLKGDKYGFNSIAISPIGTDIAISGGKLINIWKWGSDKPTHSLEGHKFTVSSLIICPKGEFVISGSLDKTIKIWNLETGELIKSLEGHEGGINSVDISNDRRYIASGSGDKSLRVWDISNDKMYGPFMHENFVQCVNFIPNTHLVIAADYNGTVRIWDFLGECLDLQSGLHGKDVAGDISQDFSKKITIFISYATADSYKYDIPRIAKLLQNSYPNIESVLFWEESMDDDIYVYMNDNLALADIVLIFCSKNANESEAVRTEWMAALKMKKKLIPIFEKEADIPPLLTTKLGLHINPNDLKGFVHELYSLIKKKTKH